MYYMYYISHVLAYITESYDYIVLSLCIIYIDFQVHILHVHVKMYIFICMLQHSIHMYGVLVVYVLVE